MHEFVTNLLTTSFPNMRPQQVQVWFALQFGTQTRGAQEHAGRCSLQPANAKSRAVWQVFKGQEFRLLCAAQYETSA